jgi:hypothetical protein
MIHLPGVLAAAGEVQSFCRTQGWRFGFIGRVALQRWGEPRLTQDVDLRVEHHLKAKCYATVNNLRLPFPGFGATMLLRDEQLSSKYRR